MIYSVCIDLLESAGLEGLRKMETVSGIATLLT